jgi:hypothetical protein
VDNFSIWRRHLAWAMENGGDLRQYMTQRYASSMVFMSLLLGAELNVLFNSAAVTTQMRKNLFAENVCTVQFWAGMTILVSVILTILSLISTFTAWGMVSSVSDANAHCILRSSIGQYVAQLPGRFIVTAVYSFLTWVSLFFFLLLPVGFWSILLVVITFALFIHVVTVFSAFGRIIMHTGAMGSKPIFDEATENRLLPHSLHASLHAKASEELGRKTSITRQYRRDRTVDSSISDYDIAALDTPEPRQRADSTVRFADTLWTGVPPRDGARTPLCEIASSRDGSETSCSQASITFPERVELQERPPWSAQVHTSQSEANFMDPLAGTHILEEWLQAQPTSTDSLKNDFEKLSQNRGPVGHGIPYAPIGKRQGENSPGRPLALLPSTIPTNGNTSVNSPIGGMSLDDDRELSGEKKYDLEYSEFYPESSQMQQHVPEHNKRETQCDFNDLEGGEPASEQQHLLHGALRDSKYSSVGTSHDGDTSPRNGH